MNAPLLAPLHQLLACEARIGRLGDAHGGGQSLAEGVAVAQAEKALDVCGFFGVVLLCYPQTYPQTLWVLRMIGFL
jgi:hypothetical protein